VVYAQASETLVFTGAFKHRNICVRILCVQFQSPAKNIHSKTVNTIEFIHTKTHFYRYRELGRLPSDAMMHLEGLLCEESGNHDRVMLMMLVLRRGWIELFAASMLRRSGSSSNVQSFVISLLSWLVPELIDAREDVELSTLAALVAINDDASGETRLQSSRRSRVVANNARPFAAKANRRLPAPSMDRNALGRMLRYQKGLMERVLINLLLSPLDPGNEAESTVAMGRDELEQRGSFLLKLLPEQGDSFDGLIKRWNNNIFHWRVIWELSGPFRRRALRALHVVATLQKPDTGGREAGSSKSAKKRPRSKDSSRSTIPQMFGEDTSAVEAWVEEHFLGLMWQITHQWQEQSLDIRDRRLRTLLEILMCLPARRLARFVPKVMAILLPNLVDDAPSQLTATSTQVLEEFAGMLDDETVREHLSAIVVAVLPLLDRCGLPAAEQSSGCEHPERARFIRQSEEAATRLLRLLIVDRAAALRDRFHTIPFVISTNVPDLEPVRRAFAEAHGNPPLGKELKHLIELLRHDSVQIKRTTLRRLNVVLETNRIQLRRLIDENDRVVSMLIHQLFAVCAQNTDRRTALLCAECLGNIGAIDPAQVQPVTTENPTSLPRQARAAPWTMSKQEFALFLVTDYLASALRESSSMEGQGTKIQDRIAFAIQKLLRIVREELDLHSSEPMPKLLEERFNESSSLDLIRPLWASSYELQEVKEPRRPPFLKRGCSYTRWLAQLCRYLIKKSQGPFSKIFEACRGAVKTSTNLAQFLLPYLVLDSLSYGCEEDNEDVVDEFLTALRDGRDVGDDASKANGASIEPVVVQAVFTLTETLEYWRATGSIPAKRARSGRSRNGGREKGALSSSNSNACWKMHLEDIDRFLQCIPRVGLARAAMRIRAYTRALRYMESIVRSKQSDILRSPDERAGFISMELSPTPADIDKLQLIYGNLDEPDGMIGLGSLRRNIAEEPKPLQRIRTLEHAEQWTAALQEYEQALQEPSALSRPSQYDASQLSGSSMDNEKEPGSEDDAEFENWESERDGILESGMLRSLLVLGHLESVLNQYDGLSTRKPHLRPVLAPIAIAAAWRLQRWSILGGYLSQWDDCTGSEEGRFEVSLAKALRAIAIGPTSCEGNITSSTNEFHHAVRRAREQAMEGLAAASRESYQRAYPLMLRLHILSETEAGIKLLASDKSKRARIIRQQDWAARLTLLSPSLPMRAPLVAVRRIIFTSAGRDDMACEDLLSYSKLARVGGNFSLAESAWRQAKCLSSSPERLLIQEAKLLHAQGQIDRALKVITPTEEDIRIVRNMAQARNGRAGSKRRGESTTYNGEDTLRQVGKRILFATDWKVEAGQIHGDPVLEQYNLAREARPKWARAYFSTAKYFDLMLVSRREVHASEDDITVHDLAKKTLHFYTESLKFGSKFLFQSMPRLLTLWFEFSQLKGTNSSLSSSTSRSARALSATHRASTPLADFQSTLNKTVNGALRSVPSHMWYTSIQQFISRVGHSESDVVEIVINALVLIATEHSRESVWSVAQLFSSQNEVRRKAGQQVLTRTTANLNERGRKKESQAFGNSRVLFQDLIKHAQFQTNEKTCRLKFTRNIEFKDYVVPNRETLTVTLHPHRPEASSSHDRSPGEFDHDPFPKSFNRILSFKEEATVMHSKAKPKKITLETTAGETVNYLCKQEKNGDLRKDARLMEFNAVINRMLQRDVSGRHRRLRLRTYSVVCLNEECGLLEWVPHTTALRTLIADAYNAYPPIENPRFASANVRERFCAIQQERSGQQQMALRYDREIVTQFTPCFHRWFLTEFVEPTAWFEARTMYTRSVATWSAVGHVVGLGDRHCENILIDTACGECVHVDFDCLFDKGVTLARPEVVPFRLTSHMVDGMGVAGHEGIFRRVMEVTFSVLREHQETLVSVLEPFLRDPSLGWERSGRAQRSDESRKRSASHDTAANSKQVLSTVRGRLRGVYNLRQSHM
jgi:serine/threonine-protein kinase ATR